MASNEKGGLFITFEVARRAVLQKALLERDRFSVELSASDWPIDRKEMFLLSFSDNLDQIDYAAIGRRKDGPHNTGGYNFGFTSFVALNGLRLARLLDRLPAGARETIEPREGNRGKWFPPQAWSGLLRLIKADYPAQAAALDRLWAGVIARDPLQSDNHIQRLAMQRDAIGLGLDVAGLSNLRRQEFRKVRPIDRGVVASSFIGLMDAQPPQERTLVDHDRGIIESVVARGPYENAVFSEGARRLRVWTVDKGPIETFAGIDLVILNEAYNSLLLLQYKCMEQEDPRSTKDWRYRPGGNFNLQVAQMERVRGLIDGAPRSESQMEDIRLDSGAFYFKFCKRLPLSQQDGELAEGMMMSLPSTLAFLDTSSARGPKNGLYIGYANCKRYLNNSLFAALARDGWIGSRGLSDRHSAEVLGLIYQNEAQSLVIAEASSVELRSGPAPVQDDTAIVDE
jgi:hypothetical protein